MINIFYEDTSFVLKNSTTLTDWVVKIITNEGYELNVLNYIFCSDEYLHQININYLQHDYYTDIITFNNSEKKKQIEGDLFISIDRVKDNANEEKTMFHVELQRVIIHGVLHLLGYDDKTDKEQLQIRAKENIYLSLLTE